MTTTDTPNTDNRSIDIWPFFTAGAREVQFRLGLAEPPKLINQSEDGQPLPEERQPPARISRRGLQSAYAAFYLLTGADPARVYCKPGVAAEPEQPSTALAILIWYARRGMYRKDYAIGDAEWANNEMLRSRTLHALTHLQYHVCAVASTEDRYSAFLADGSNPQLVELPAVHRRTPDIQAYQRVATAYQLVACAAAITRVPGDRRMLATLEFQRYLMSVEMREGEETATIDHLRNLMVAIYGD